MTPERVARIRKSFTCADIDDLCDAMEEMFKTVKTYKEVIDNLYSANDSLHKDVAKLMKTLHCHNLITIELQQAKDACDKYGCGSSD